MALYRRHPEFPLVVAANRDEHVERPSAPPGVIREAPGAIGGKDLVAGGTWLGLNAHGILVAVTNRPGGDGAPRRSRGILAVDALGMARVAELQRRVAEAARDYDPFNLIALGTNAGVVVTWDGSAARARVVEPGALVVTNGEPNDRGIPNVARGLQVLECLGQAPEETLLSRLAAACADHRQEDPAHPPFCLHRAPYGTVSSTILLLREDGTGRYLFAPGPPCTTAYEEYSCLLPVREDGSAGASPSGSTWGGSAGASPSGSTWGGSAGASPSGSTWGGSAGASPSGSTWGGSAGASPSGTAHNGSAGASPSGRAE